jgi:hypothetical protein
MKTEAHLVNFVVYKVVTGCELELANFHLSKLSNILFKNLDPAEKQLVICSFLPDPFLQARHCGCARKNFSAELFNGVFNVENGVALLFIFINNVLPDFFLGFVDVAQTSLVVIFALHDLQHVDVEGRFQGGHVSVQLLNVRLHLFEFVLKIGFDGFEF